MKSKGVGGSWVQAKRAYVNEGEVVGSGEPEVLLQDAAHLHMQHRLLLRLQPRNNKGSIAASGGEGGGGGGGANFIKKKRKFQLRTGDQ